MQRTPSPAKAAMKEHLQSQGIVVINKNLKRECRKFVVAASLPSSNAAAALDDIVVGHVANRHARLGLAETHSGAEVDAGADVHSSDCRGWPLACGVTVSGLSSTTVSAALADVAAAADGLAAVCSAIGFLEDAEIL